jgi:lipopolysaccharide heptosyltransferase II
VKALLVRLSSIGDVVHTLPALAALRRAGFECGWLVEPAARPLLDGNPALARAVTMPPARRFALGEARAALTSLRRAGYDVALDFQGLWKSALWARLSRAGRSVGFSGDARREPLSGVLLHETLQPRPEAAHVIDKNLALLRAVGVEALGLREFPLPALDADTERVEAQLTALGLERFALLNPGGGWASKQWPVESFGALARGLAGHGLPSLVTFGPGEEGLADRVVAASAGAAQRSFPTTLRELVALARRATLVVAADTGPLHIACAVGTPVVGLYGPTDPARNGPFSSADVVVREVPPCAPCHRRDCPHDGAMARIAVDAVLAAAVRRLEVCAKEPRAV